jgi:hypothetical protein
MCRGAKRVTKVFLGIMSRAGDRLGHLVRAVQMLRSYGSEVDVISYSDVINATVSADQAPALCCMLECSSTADEGALRGICRETQWALGDEDEVCTVQILKYGDHLGDAPPAPLQALQQGGKLPEGMAVFESRYDFAKLCDWGQQLTYGDADIAGEWPSATGR